MKTERLGGRKGRERLRRLIGQQRLLTIARPRAAKRQFERRTGWKDADARTPPSRIDRSVYPPQSHARNTAPFPLSPHGFRRLSRPDSSEGSYGATVRSRAWESGPRCEGRVGSLGPRHLEWLRTYPQTPARSISGIRSRTLGFQTTGLWNTFLSLSISIYLSRYRARGPKPTCEYLP